MNIEEFVNDYLQEHRHDVLLNPHNGLVEFAEALKAEALKEAVEGIVTTRSMAGNIVTAHINHQFTNGQKVKLIIVKED